MRSLLDLRLVLAFCALSSAAAAQVAPQVPFVPKEEQAPQTPVQPGQPPRPGQPTTTPAQGPLPPSDAPKLADTGSFLFPNASLTEMIELLARRLKINYILDPNVKGNVSIYTYGEVKPVDYMPLLETILRVNGATIVRVGDWYRIIPVNKVSAMPLQPQINPESKTLPQDERMMLNLIFL